MTLIDRRWTAPGLVLLLAGLLVGTTGCPPEEADDDVSGDDDSTSDDDTADDDDDVSGDDDSTSDDDTADDDDDATDDDDTTGDDDDTSDDDATGDDDVTGDDDATGDDDDTTDDDDVTGDDDSTGDDDTTGDDDATGDDDSTGDDDATGDDDTTAPVDQDGDGWDASVDCDDNDPTLNLDDVDGDGASTCDGDCDDNDPVLNKDDADGDLADTCEGDCDDQDAAVSPYLQETCNDGLDNDCDGTVNDCVLSGEYDLYSVGDYLLGGENHDQAGSAIAGAGDLNGDGFDDLVIGAHLSDPGYFNEGGAAFVVAGPVTGGVDLGISAVRLAGETTGTWAGFSVAGGCDIDADGNDDLLVGAPERDVNGTASGVAYLDYGPVPGDGNLASSDARLMGMHAEDRAGYALDCRGDTNGDGYADMLVGAPGDDAGGTDAGAAFLVLGPMWGDFDLDAPDAGLLGEGPGDLAGSAVAMAGDTDDDGFDDLMVGAYQADVAAIDAGAVYLFRGPTTGIVSLATADARITGEAAGDLAGWSVAAAGDVNGDGFDDLFIGARGESSMGSLAGAAYLLLGPVAGQVSLTAADAKMVGEAAQDYAGTSVAGVGDVNGDGFDDLLIGSPGNDTPAFDAGAAYLFHGPLTGYHTLDLADAKLIGWDAFDEAGTEVAAAGDVDGDGYDDMFVGSPLCDAGGLDAGASYLVPGVGL